MKHCSEKKQQFPVIDTGRCNLCEGCISVAPEVFVLNEDIGKIRIKDLTEFPEHLVEEAIKNCPKKCISWDPE